MLIENKFVSSSRVGPAEHIEINVGHDITDDMLLRWKEMSISSDEYRSDAMRYFGSVVGALCRARLRISDYERASVRKEPIFDVRKPGVHQEEQQRYQPIGYTPESWQIV